MVVGALCKYAKGYDSFWIGWNVHNRISGHVENMIRKERVQSETCFSRQ